MQELQLCSKFAVLKAEGTGRVGKPKLRWLESVEDVQKMGVRNGRREKLDREQWGGNFGRG